MTTETAALYHDSCHHKIYHLTCAQFDELHAYAEGRCQICRTPEGETKRGRLSIDHMGDYGFQVVRGLLCDPCNTLMTFIDGGRAASLRRSYDRGAVISYRYNAWFARQVHPKGPNVRVIQRGLR